MKRLGAERYSKSRWKYGDAVAFAADREANGQPWAPPTKRRPSSSSTLPRASQQRSTSALRIRSTHAADW